MVFEQRSSAALVHRAPPLPIVPNGGRTTSHRTNNNYNKAGFNGRQSHRASIGHFSPTLTNNSYSNGQQQQQPRKSQVPCPSADKGRQQPAPVGPLSIEEYERDFRLAASDLELTERVFRGGLASNQLRAALWPYLFGLVKRRGRFARCSPPPNEQPAYVYVEHEDNVRRWHHLERLYGTYENQWKSIQADQELRFSSFRERKSLIERDVVRSDRTHPFYSSHNQRYAENLAALTRVLMSYMMYDFDIGYLQGMSDLAAPILYVFQGDVVRTFWLFVEVMKLFRRNFEFSQKTIHFQLNCLFRLVKLTDLKLANHLREMECSNCFFLFRHIVCQFKRELIRANDSQSSTPADSSAGSNAEDLDSSGESTSGASTIKDGQRPRSNDYANVLNLWDTIWFVQRRHELRQQSKCVHTYKIATTATAKSGATPGNTKEFAGSGGGGAQANSLACCCCCKHRLGQNNLKNTSTNQVNHCNNNNNNNITYNNNQKQRRSSYQQRSKAKAATNTDGLSSTTTISVDTSNIVASTATKTYLNNNGHPTTKTTTRRTSTASSNLSLASTTTTDSSISSTSTNTSSPSATSSITSTKQTSPFNPSSSTCCSLCLRSGENRREQKVKQEQVVYTKETFYSSFDPNQADVPRFELTETEKFVISLCLSLIRRERNYILNNRLDASEIHQHFIRPRLASDLGQFLGQAHEIYHFLNHECDLQSLVRGASEFANPNECSPIAQPLATASARGNTLAAAATAAAAVAANPRQLTANDQASSSSATTTTDTYDLLKDYFIISPTAYDISMNSLNHLDSLSPVSLSSGGGGGCSATGGYPHQHQMALRRRASSGALLNSSLHACRSSWDQHFVSSTPSNIIHSATHIGLS